MRPRYGRLAAALVALTVTVVAVLGASSALAPSAGPAPATAQTGPGVAVLTQATASRLRAADVARTRLPEREPAAQHAGATQPLDASGGSDGSALPPRSGTGRRVVFDIGEQRVWLVDADGRVRRSYPVSGSLTDNLRPGRYRVYSTSRHAVGVDDSGTMEYMVRFAHGPRAAIGFHDIPVVDGEPVQTRDQLGTPQSHGCIRQWRPDARALWYFAIIGTTVVVTA